LEGLRIGAHGPSPVVQSIRSELSLHSPQLSSVNQYHRRSHFAFMRAASSIRENTMNRHNVFIVAALTALGFAYLSSSAVAQQTGPTMHKYLSRAVMTPEGIKNLQKQPPTALKAGIAKFTEAVGGKLESWYFDFGTSTGWAIIDYPDDIGAAAAAMTINAAGFARVTLTPLITAEEADKALAKITRPPQQQ
jgi:uncharacterized protein with GYD domain